MRTDWLTRRRGYRQGDYHGGHKLQLLAWLMDRRQDGIRPPSYREMAHHLGVSLHQVQLYLASLQRVGLLESPPADLLARTVTLACRFIPADRL